MVEFVQGLVGTFSEDKGQPLGGQAFPDIPNGTELKVVDVPYKGGVTVRFLEAAGKYDEGQEIGMRQDLFVPALSCE